MKKKSEFYDMFLAAIGTFSILAGMGIIINLVEPDCIYSGCDRDVYCTGNYCYLHTSHSEYNSNSYNVISKPKVYPVDTNKTYSTTTSTNKNTHSSSGKYSSSSSSKSSSSSNKSWEAYDEGYEDVYENDDYDWDRYWSDSDYADGVDDALEDVEW